MASKTELAEETCRALILRIVRPSKGKKARLHLAFVAESNGHNLKLPGGRPKEEDDSRMACVIREVKEEMDVDLSGMKPLVSEDGVFFSKEEKQDNHHTSVLVYVAKEYVPTENETEDKDVDYPAWIPGRKLPLVKEHSSSAIVLEDTKKYIHTIFSLREYREAINNRGVPMEEIETIRQRIEDPFSQKETA